MQFNEIIIAIKVWLFAIKVRKKRRENICFACRRYCVDDYGDCIYDHNCELPNCVDVCSSCGRGIDLRDMRIFDINCIYCRKEKEYRITHDNNNKR